MREKLGLCRKCLVQGSQPTWKSGKSVKMDFCLEKTQAIIREFSLNISEILENFYFSRKIFLVVNFRLALFSVMLVFIF